MTLVALWDALETVQNGLLVIFLNIGSKRILSQDWMLVCFAESISVERNTLEHGIYPKLTGLDAQRAPELGLMGVNNFIRAFWTSIVRIVLGFTKF